METQAPSEQYYKMKAGEPYVFDDYLYSLQKKCSETMLQINSLPFGDKKRDELFHELFESYGKGNVIKEGFRCNFGTNISIGNGCYINFNVVFLDSGLIKLGDNVFIGPGTVVSAVTHPLEAKNRRNLQINKIEIGNDVWLGTNVVILPGVTIGDGAVIGAGSVVKDDIPSNTVYAGTLAHYIRSIDNDPQGGKL